MASVLLSPFGVGQQFFDDNGVPLAGGLIYTYQAGSSTPLVTYTTNGGTIANANPIVLDASGRTPQQIWLLTGYSYKFVLQNADAVLIQTLDNIYPILQNAPVSSPAVPTGCILLWSGSTGSIPATWYLCDGTNGTPRYGGETRPKNISLIFCVKAIPTTTEGGTTVMSSFTLVEVSTTAAEMLTPGIFKNFTVGDLSFIFGVILGLVVVWGYRAGGLK